MELLIQQCVTAQDGSLSMPSAAADARENAVANATILDLLAQTCADANAAVQELSVEEVAAGLANAVSATQESLRSVGQNVGAILQDPEQMRELCYHVKQADAKVLEALQTSQVLLEDQSDGSKGDGALVSDKDMGSTALMVPTDEENVHNMMVFAENIGQVKRAAVLRTYVTDLYNRTREEAVEHPFLAGALTAAGLPFIGLAIPVASMVALALMIEKHYPEHAKLTLELCSNFVQVNTLLTTVMGLKQSALKKEIAALQQEARKRSAKHQEELATAAKEKRQLQAKIDELQELIAQAKEEAEQAKNEAREQEERMKALKWELVRQLRLTGSPTTSPRAPLSPSSSTRIDLNWRLNDDLSLRQSVGPPKKAPNEVPASTDTTTSSNTPIATTLAPRRSLLKRSEPTSSAPSANQTPDVDTKETRKPATPKPAPASAEEKTSNEDVFPSELKQDDNVNDRSPREFKTESSCDDSPPKSNGVKAEDDEDDEDDDALPSESHVHNAESKDNDDNPEAGDTRSYSEDYK
ncbi:ATP-dependent RNA helicase dbp5 [Phytophthora nicotianae]|uniref:ATP-dependent RNA helicase dbp5 n=1 Tax=Phytophthora nicotianae TaxID=4792 RepID=A0A0W8DND5_PHYNI|nr:ATP-dependent RNA helicase dbp5 [Phytophthora nicotianae]